MVESDDPGASPALRKTRVWRYQPRPEAGASLTLTRQQPRPHHSTVLLAALLSSTPPTPTPTTIYFIMPTTSSPCPPSPSPSRSPRFHLRPRPRRPSAAVSAPPVTSSQHPQQQPERVCDTILVPQNLILSRLLHTNHHNSTLQPPPTVSESSSSPQMATAAHQNPSYSYPMDIDTASTEPIADPAHPKLAAPPIAASRKLCVRHQRMADEGTTNKTQQVSHFSSFPSHFPSLHSPSSLPGAHLAISRASTPSHSPNANPSTISGPLSPLPLMRVVSSSFAVSSPCVASPSFLSSLRSSAISFVSILSLSYPRR